MVEIDHGFTTEMKYAITGTFTGGLSSKGYRLMKQGTKDSWYNIATVYPVCPDKSEVEGDKAYPSLKDLPDIVDVVIVVHKKDLTTEIVRDAATLKSRPSIWFMPGTQSEESVAICEENDMKFASSCIMGHRLIPGWKRYFNFHNFHAKVAGMNRIPKQD
jgi:predicted CoA-binding protein